MVETKEPQLENFSGPDDRSQTPVSLTIPANPRTDTPQWPMVFLILLQP